MYRRKYPLICGFLARSKLIYQTSIDFYIAILVLNVILIIALLFGLELFIKPHR